MSDTTKGEDILGMSDEEFGKLNGPQQEDTAAAAGAEDGVAKEEKNEEDGAQAAGDTGAEKGEADGQAPSTEEPAKGETTQEGENAAAGEGVSPDKAETQKGNEAKAGAPEKQPEKQTDTTTTKAQGDAGKEPVSPDAMAEFYRRVVDTPIKANGKLIKLNNADEAIALMQQGANYTRKMQDLAPYRRAMAMLEKHGLLGEDELSYLIDIKNKNPDAIRKLIKESGLDTHDLDENEASKNYRPGNHRVTDEEVQFRDTMDQLKAMDDGQATLNEIHRTWDDASKDILWTQPGIMTDIHMHRANGFYAMVTDEMARLKALGQLPASTPFLHAYKQIGDRFIAEGNIPEGIKAAAAASNGSGSKAPVVTARTTTTKPVVSNRDKAAAASNTRSTTTVASRPGNPLAMSDDEFMKQFENRL